MIFMRKCFKTSDIAAKGTVLWLKMSRRTVPMVENGPENRPRGWLWLVYTNETQYFRQKI